MQGTGMFMPQNNDPDYVYLDVNAYNFQNVNQPSPVLKFEQSRNNPVLHNSGDYVMSIVRFQLDTFNLPTFIAEIEPNQSNRDLTIDSITLEYDDGLNPVTTVQQPIIWIPQNTYVTPPPPPSSTSNGLQYPSEYYHCYSFKYYIDLINNAFSAATSTLNTTLGTSIVAPFMYWNSDKVSATLYAEQSRFDSTSSPIVRIYFNQALYAHFNSFIALNNGPSATLGRNYQILIEKYQNVNSVTFGAITYLFNDQEYSTIDTWTPINSIVFTSSSLPIIPTQVSQPAIYTNSSLIQGSNGNNANISRIITDLQTNEMVYKPNLLYAPSAEYRRISMTGNQTINDISIEIYWKDKFGTLFPMYLEPGASASVKILFEKKFKTKQAVV